MVVGVARIPNFLKIASPAGSWRMARKAMKLLSRKLLNLEFS
jgi:hypothetical protein